MGGAWLMAQPAAAEKELVKAAHMQHSISARQQS